MGVRGSGVHTQAGAREDSRGPGSPSPEEVPPWMWTKVGEPTFHAVLQMGSQWPRVGEDLRGRPAGPSESQASGAGILARIIFLAPEPQAHWGEGGGGWERGAGAGRGPAAAVSRQPRTALAWVSAGPVGRRPGEGG